MRKEQIIYLIPLLLSGCYSMNNDPPPKMSAYADSVKGDGSKELMANVLTDLDRAADWCWTRSNNYEKRTKNAEGWRLGVGAGGGVMGFTGAMLAAAGTGGFAGAITAGLAGVASATLANAEKGPLSPKEFADERDAIAVKIDERVKAALAASDPLEIHKIAIGLKQTCRADLTTKSKTGS